MVTTRPPKTIVKPTALGPVANTDTKLLIYGLFQRGRVLAQDAEASPAARNTLDSARIPRASKLLICGLFQKGRVLAQDGMMEEVARCQPNGLTAFDNGTDDVGSQECITDCLAHAVRWDGVFGGNLLIGFACFDSVEPGEGVGDIAQECAVDGFRGVAALLHRSG